MDWSEVCGGNGRLDFFKALQNSITRLNLSVK